MSRVRAVGMWGQSYSHSKPRGFTWGHEMGQGPRGGPSPCDCVLPGEVFYATSPEKFTFQEAASECRRLGARLATTGQLYLAWQGGMDMCSAGWLADRSVRYPISQARPNCGGNLLGVRTVYLHANQTGYPDPSSRYDAICYTGGPQWGAL